MVWGACYANGAGRLSGTPRTVMLGAGMVLASLALFVANSALAWREGWMAASDATRAGAVGPTLLLAGVLALLTLWTVGWRSTAALWLLVVVVGIAVVLTGYRVVSGELPAGAIGAIAIVDAALAAGGVALLLVGRGARAWFKQREVG